MFPFQRSGELSFQVCNDFENTGNSNSNSNSSSNNCYNPTGTERDVNPPSATHLHLSRQPAASTARRGRPRIRPPPNIEVNINEDRAQISGNNNDATQRRIIHREIERQRRQEMANLYSSLRNLLPIEYIRGKRSMCDHITEAGKYIKDLENNIKELRDKRDMLKASSSSYGGHVGCSSSTTSSWKNDFNVNIDSSSSGAVEVEIGVGVGVEDVFPLSRVLNKLFQQGLNVVDCVSTRADQRCIYMIHCEVSHEITVDSSQLQQQLMNEIASSHD